MSTHYKVVYDCGHEEPARKYLPLFIPQVGHGIWCWICRTTRRIASVTPVEIQEKPRKAKSHG